MVANLYDQLIRDEGEILHAYQDSLGYWTIGVGHLIDPRKGGSIPESISRQLLEMDVNKFDQFISTSLPWADMLDNVRRGALVNMAFNLGENLLEFRNFLGKLQTGDYAGAARDMLESKWAEQVGARAQRLSIQIESGEWQ
jgi:lysozyme